MHRRHQLPETTLAAHAPKRVGHRRWVFVVLGVLLCATIVFVFLPTDSSSRKFTWLSPTQFAAATRIAPFTRLKYKVMDVFAPVFRWHRSKEPYIKITSHIMAISPTTTRPTGPGVPIATNTNGVCAWILSTSEMASFGQELEAVPKLSFYPHRSVRSRSGIQIRFLVGLMFQDPWSSVAGPATGIGVDVNTRVSNDGAELVLKQVQPNGLINMHPTPPFSKRTFSRPVAFSFLEPAVL